MSMSSTEKAVQGTRVGPPEFPVHAHRHDPHQGIPIPWSQWHNYMNYMGSGGPGRT